MQPLATVLSCQNFLMGSVQLVLSPPAPLDMPVKGIVAELSSAEVARLVALLRPQRRLPPPLRASPLQTTLFNLGLRRKAINLRKNRLLKFYLFFPECLNWTEK